MVTKHGAPAERGEGLRERVLKAARELIDQQGLAALSMREVARRAGVSHQAPYNHFADRQAILAALAEDGFHALAARFREALAASLSAGLLGRVTALGRAYIAFAMEQPAYFRVMFRPELVDLTRYDRAQEAGDAAFEYLHAAVAELMEAGLLPGAHCDAVAALMWSIVHGFACLALDGPLARSFEGLDLPALTEGVLEQLARLIEAALPGAR
jgi:AcrR family transcriptional regulator